MRAQRFGNAHTEKKLQLVAHYLECYATALKNQRFERLYIDAFAGTGAWTKRNKSSEPQLPLLDVDDIKEGSARRALRVEPPFDRYIFIEKSRRKSSALRRLGQEFPALAHSIEVVTKDANEALWELCRRTDWRKSRAVVFLDPFGFEVRWETVETFTHQTALSAAHGRASAGSVAYWTAMAGKRPWTNRDGTIRSSSLMKPSLSPLAIVPVVNAGARLWELSFQPGKGRRG